MAAAYADSMRDIGLHPLPPAACHAAFQAAGYAPRMVHAQIALSQFRRVNTAKGPWPFLNQLALVPASSSPSPAAADTSAGQPASQSLHLSSSVHAAAAAAQALGLEDVVQLVRAAASELLGEDIGAEGHFAGHHFDSLSAVELANAVGRAAGCELPGTLVFDYPSVQGAAQYVRGLMRPKQPLAPDQAITPRNIGAAARAPQQQYTSLIRIGVSVRLPHGADAGAFGPDAITTDPSSR